MPPPPLSSFPEMTGSSGSGGKGAAWRDAVGGGVGGLVGLLSVIAVIIALRRRRGRHQVQEHEGLRVSDTAEASSNTVTAGIGALE